MPCGTPVVTWPYSCDIDDNNGLNFDSSTGKLWVKPQVGVSTYTTSPAFAPVPGRYQFAGTGEAEAPLRVWAAGCFRDLGALATFACTSLATVSHTNTTCLTQRIRGLVRVPAVRLLSTYQTNRFAITARGYVNGGLSAVSALVPHDGTFGAYVSPGSVGYPFSAGYPRTGFIPSAAIPGDGDALAPGYLSTRFPGYSVDLFGGWRTVAPGATITLGYQLGGQTPETCPPLYTVGEFPDTPYFASYADLLDEGTLTVEVHAL